MKKSPKFDFITAVTLMVMIAPILLMPQTINAESENSKFESSSVSFVQDDQLYIDKLYTTSYQVQVVKTIKMVITAYTSTPDQTKDYGSPFITASNKHVADGFVANNLLPFGTKIKIPALYGDKVFTVEDRMNERMGSYHIDIWFPGAESGRAKALEFGKKITDVQIIES